MVLKDALYLTPTPTLNENEEIPYCPYRLFCHTPIITPTGYAFRIVTLSNGIELPSPFTKRLNRTPIPGNRISET
jgi:hypothetical protein